MKSKNPNGRILKSTSFSDFIRYATNKERKKVFKKVLMQSCKDQANIVNKANEE